MFMHKNIIVLAESDDYTHFLERKDDGTVVSGFHKKGTEETHYVDPDMYIDNEKRLQAYETVLCFVVSNKKKGHEFTEEQTVILLTYLASSLFNVNININMKD